jgi:hypothetical protein
MNKILSCAAVVGLLIASSFAVLLFKNDSERNRHPLGYDHQSGLRLPSRFNRQTRMVKFVIRATAIAWREACRQRQYG